MSDANPSPTSTEAADLAARCKALLAAFPPGKVDAITFREAQFDHGLAWVHLPEGLGGLSLPAGRQAVVDELLAASGAPGDPDDSVIGLGMAAPVISTHGSPEQQRRYLRPLFSGAEIWCQLFSEPGAGSDVAGLATSARWTGEEWLVNGQKVWTSLAHRAAFGLLAARTDPSQPKHRGITYFIMDMRAAGVDVRPLRQMTGDAEFNEVFFTDARIPDSQRVGETDGGWQVMVTTLMNERVTIGGALGQGGGPIADALRLWKHSTDKSPVMRDRLAGLWIDAECARLTALRAAHRAKTGTPGPEGAVGKLAATHINQKVYDFCMDLLGPEATLYTGYTPGDQDPSSHRRDPRWQYLRSRANTIEGGTSEILRNILAERILGLPQEPRNDRTTPWSEVPRN